MTIDVLMSVDNKCFLMRIHTLAQLLSQSSSVFRSSRISLSSIDSRSRDAKAHDQYGELSQWLELSQNCDIALNLKDIFIILMYSSPSSVSILKMGTLNAGILVSVFLPVPLTIWLDLLRLSIDLLLYSTNHVVRAWYPIPGDKYSF